MSSLITVTVWGSCNDRAWMKYTACTAYFYIFSESAPLGRFSHRVAMSGWLCVCLRHWVQFFLGLPLAHLISSRPLIGRPPHIVCMGRDICCCFTKYMMYYKYAITWNNIITKGGPWGIIIIFILFTRLKLCYETKNKFDSFHDFKDPIHATLFSAIIMLHYNQFRYCAVQFTEVKCTVVHCGALVTVKHYSIYHWGNILISRCSSILTAR